ncbi:hypothetical protein TNCV_3994151 [Trichonephila clavipes]|uniref:Uncharacterized protein n=1 Tax=Trichonephila clavipes TaxID=2585209 RepID=A0A8X6SXY6_TRICX|nr:hypothetical protein TNCV_3994151 [Trichonephila clavipes]
MIDRRRRDMQIKVKDWVLIKSHHLSIATKKVIAKFKPIFEGSYSVLDVKHNDLGIWKSGKSVQRRSNESEYGRKKGSGEKCELEGKGIRFKKDQGERLTGTIDKCGALISLAPSSWTTTVNRTKRGRKETLAYKRALKLESEGSRK